MWNGFDYLKWECHLQLCIKQPLQEKMMSVTVRHSNTFFSKEKQTHHKNELTSFILGILVFAILHIPQQHFQSVLSRFISLHFAVIPVTNDNSNSFIPNTSFCKDNIMSWQSCKINTWRLYGISVNHCTLQQNKFISGCEPTTRVNFQLHVGHHPKN